MLSFPKFINFKLEWDLDSGTYYFFAWGDGLFEKDFFLIKNGFSLLFLLICANDYSSPVLKLVDNLSRLGLLESLSWKKFINVLITWTGYYWSS